MIKFEQFLIASVLLGVACLTVFDIIIDLAGGSTLWHISIEIVIALIASIGFIYLLNNSITLRLIIKNEKILTDQLKAENNRFKQQSKVYISGLSVVIDEQLSRWQLSEAEKEIAFLLIKGHSLKTIASVRGTTEKTARTQSATIYSKAGLSSRAELAAFFLEDLLLPANI